MTTVRLPLRSLPLVALALTVLVLAACSAGPSVQPSSSASGQGSPGSASGWASAIGSTPVVPYLASPELAVGKERFLFTLIDQASHIVAGPNVVVHVRFFDLGRDPSVAAAESDGIFFWIIQGQRGLYRAPVTFSAAGQWGAEFAITRTGAPPSSTALAGQTPAADPLASPVTVRVAFTVLGHPSVPAVGDPAPPVDTPTLASAGGNPKMISTDNDPDPRLYQLSVKDALAAKKPFLLFFGTPAFCESATCGPTLLVVKQVLAGFPTLTAIHVEPYKLVWTGASLQPVYDAAGHLQPIPAVLTWNLPTEPYTFLVDTNGKIAARFDGAIDPPELRDAIKALLGA